MELARVFELSHSCVEQRGRESGEVHSEVMEVFVEGIEDRLLGVACEELQRVVGGGAVGCGGVEEQAVGLGRAGYGREPVTNKTQKNVKIVENNYKLCYSTFKNRRICFKISYSHILDAKNK